MTIARASVTSPDENYRSVAKAVLDVTAEALSIQKAIAEDGRVDLAPYFDFWFGDAVGCANKLLQYDDKEARHLGQCLIDLEKASIKSKESFLAEMKRLGIQPSAG
jgi:hypothetical protein